MGISVSASTAIIVAGLFFAFIAFYPVAANGFERVTAANQDVGERALERQNTDVDVGSATIEDDELVVNATNDGTTGQAVSDTTLLVNNEYVPLSDVDTTVRDGDDSTADTDLWLPGETLEVTLTDDDLAGGSVSDVERVVLVTESGVRDAASVEDEDEDNGGDA